MRPGGLKGAAPVTGVVTGRAPPIGFSFGRGRPITPEGVRKALMECANGPERKHGRIQTLRSRPFSPANKARKADGYFPPERFGLR
jgi:hypothetical protein